MSVVKVQNLELDTSLIPCSFADGALTTEHGEEDEE